ncbi:hypothetical protein ACFLWX_01330 [Chloroflexota bacterium]
MTDQTLNNRKTIIVLILAAIAAIMFLLSLFYTSPIYQNSRLADPLAGVHSLSALYYASLVITALLGIGCFLFKVSSRYAQILVLILFALILWFTPYYLPGFTRSPDNPWHVGVAMHMPQLLAGETVSFSNYAQSYPGSFIHSYALVDTLGIGAERYMNAIFPLVFAFLFILLWYLFTSRFLNERAVFLSMLIAIPGLHYMGLSPSPRSIGFLLFMTALVLVTRRSMVAKVLALAIVIAMVFSHPISPVIFMVFLGAFIVTSWRQIRGERVALIALMLVAFVGWGLFFSSIVALWAQQGGAGGGTGGSVVGGIVEQVGRELTSGLGDARTTREYLLGAPSFLYQGIYNLNRGIYFVYGIGGALAALMVVLGTYRKRKGIKDWIIRLGGLEQGEVLMIIGTILLVAVTIFLAERYYQMMERSLTFLVLTLSTIIASVIIRWKNTVIKRIVLHPLVTIAVLFLGLTFPTILFMTDAYTSTPSSEEAGLSFIAEKVPLEEMEVAQTIGRLKQLIWNLQYLDKTREVKFPSPSKLEEMDFQPDVAIFRSTGYYWASMRIDLSLEDNRYISYLNMVNGEDYDRVYSSPTFQVYVKGSN